MLTQVDPIFAYFAILAVIQPARIQEIEASAQKILPLNDARTLVEGGYLRKVHDEARKKGWVIAVRRGVYFTAEKARHVVRREGLQRSIDNRRFFLMKVQRRRYK